MTAPLREQTKNNATTTLNGSITNSATSITVTSGSVFPSTGNFRLVCEDEIMICTARSSNTLTVTRGAEGTTGASHADLKTITHVLTSDGFDRLGKDSVALWGDSTLAPLNRLVASNGTTLLTSSDFTWTNQGTASVADYNGTIALRAPSTSNDQHRILTVAVPSAPWTCIMAVTIFLPGPATSTNCQLGTAIRESGTGKIYSFGLNRQSGNAMRFAIDKWTNNTFNSTPFIANNPICVPQIVWFKVEDNNTNLIFYVSTDGVEWIQLFSESRTTHMAGAPDQIGISANNGSDTNGKDAMVRLLHFHFE